MTRDIPLPEDVRILVENMGGDPESVWHNCHAASVALVKSGLAGPDARVARGFAKGVGLGQHSWVVVGSPYDRHAHIIDLTLWSYDPAVKGVWQGTLEDGVHHPHGEGFFMEGNHPTHHGGRTIHLTPATPLSRKATGWLRTVGAPFDAQGWIQIASLPVGGWPASEIIEAMLDTPGLSALVPIDIAGHLTNRHPEYFYTKESAR